MTAFERGDVVAAPFSYSDNACDYCHAGIYTSCRHGGFWDGTDEDGGQAEFVRVPFADGTLRSIPAAVAHDERKRASALTATDVMSTGHHGCAYIDELIADVAAGTIDPGAVLTLRLPPDEAPRGYAAMDDRSTIKVMLDVSAL